jgi:hypothetical protein
MNLSKNKQNIFIESNLLDNVGSTYKINMTSTKNCCQVSEKIIVQEHINSSSILTIKDNKYYPTAVATKLSTINFLLNGTSYLFQLTTLNNLYTQITNIIDAYNLWKLSHPDFSNSIMTITNVNRVITITITNLHSGTTINTSTFISDTNTIYNGEIENKSKYLIAPYIGDGVYKFKLSLENLITGSKQTEEACITILDDIKCLIPENLVKNPKSMAHLMYYTLNQNVDCNCICDDLCLLYNNLIEEIKWT